MPRAAEEAAILKPKDDRPPTDRSRSPRAIAVIRVPGNLNGSARGHAPRIRAKNTVGPVDDAIPRSAAY